MAAAAKHLTPVLLELGGKSPVVVDSSINLLVKRTVFSLHSLMVPPFHCPGKYFAISIIITTTSTFVSRANLYLFILPRLQLEG